MKGRGEGQRGRDTGERHWRRYIQEAKVRDREEQTEGKRQRGEKEGKRQRGRD